LNRRALAISFAAVALALGGLKPAVEVRSASAQPAPSSAPVPTESALIEIEEGPPSPTPTARRRNGRPTPTPTPSPVPTETPEPTPSPTPTPTPSPTAAPPTVAPTATPTPRAVAPSQPTVAQSLEDPNVQSILRRPIALLNTFGWMLGTWRAHNVEERGDGRRHDLGTNTYVFAATMKGRWIFGGDGKSTDYFYITYDPFSEKWALVRLNGNPSYGIWISDRGWHGNAIEFTSSYSSANGRQYHRRITLIRQGARAFGIYNEEQLSDGSWTGDDMVELLKQQ
jgi:hypothetical protein